MNTDEVTVRAGAGWDRARREGFGVSVHTAPTRPPLPPATVIKYACGGCDYATDWFFFEDDELARSEMRKHVASCIVAGH